VSDRNGRLGGRCSSNHCNDPYVRLHAVSDAFGNSPLKFALTRLPTRGGGFFVFSARKTDFFIDTAIAGGAAATLSLLSIELLDKVGKRS
jgi:hypothetical protein